MLIPLLASATAFAPRTAAVLRVGAARACTPRLVSPDDDSANLSGDFDYEADLRRTLQARAARQVTAEAMDRRYVSRYRSAGLDLQMLNSTSPRGHGLWSAKVTKGIQPASAEPYEVKRAGPGNLRAAEEAFFAVLDGIRADLFLLASFVVIVLVLCLSTPAPAAASELSTAMQHEQQHQHVGMLPGGLLAASDDVFAWIAQNAALETVWLAAIAVAIASVALGDPKR